MQQLRRSDINNSIMLAQKVIGYFGVHLPFFAYWAQEQWAKAGNEFDEIRDCMLGWDVTDFGSMDFKNIGRILFTLRNGKPNNKAYPKEYAEKLLIDPEHQRAPAHFHRSKREDIICRRGGNILVQLTKADPFGNPSNEQFTVQKDGRTLYLSPGDIVRLCPGESVNIPPGTIHQFWGEEGTGVKMEGVGFTLSSEISSVCDDWEDNVFIEKNAVRFPSVDEDEEPRFLLCHEYPAAS
ncbi:MAG TPA: D-lyxose/D-mannose family sugar isomerase [Agriterribacter sp.]|nr:D-lyxose/D-mannose family sugar isomerase [Agriterribacter sp.]